MAKLQEIKKQFTSLIAMITGLFNNKVGNENTEITAITQVERFAIKNHVISGPFPELTSGQFNKRRQIIQKIKCAVLWLMQVRWLIMMIWGKNQTAARFNGDWNSMFGRHRNSIMFSLVAWFTLALSYQTLEIIKEHQLRLSFLEMLDAARHGESVKLTPNNQRRFQWISTIVCHINLRLLYPILTIGLWSSVLIHASLAYYNLNINYPLTLYIILNIHIMWSERQCILLLIAVICSAVPLSIIYVLMRFGQVVDNIQSAIKRQNLNQLIKAVREHYEVTSILQEYNKSLSDCFLILYLILALTADITIYIMIYNESLFLNFVAGSFVMASVWALCLFNFMFNLIAAKAHHPHKMLHSLVARQDIQLPIEERLKVINLIERLGQDKLGFTRWKISVMNSYSFYEFIAYAASTFVLMVGLLKN